MLGLKVACLLSWQLLLIYSSFPTMDIISLSVVSAILFCHSFPCQILCLLHSGNNLTGAERRCTVTQPDLSCCTETHQYLSSDTQITAPVQQKRNSSFLKWGAISLFLYTANLYFTRSHIPTPTLPSRFLFWRFYFAALMGVQRQAAKLAGRGQHGTLWSGLCFIGMHTHMVTHTDTCMHMAQAEDQLSWNSFWVRDFQCYGCCQPHRWKGCRELGWMPVRS